MAPSLSEISPSNEIFIDSNSLDIWDEYLVIICWIYVENAYLNITTTTAILRPSGLCLGQPGWAVSRRNIHPLTYLNIRLTIFFHWPSPPGRDPCLQVKSAITVPEYILYLLHVLDADLFVSRVLKFLCIDLRLANEVALLLAEMRMVRWMCGVKLQNRIPSKGLRERLGLDDIISVLQQNRLWWYGHVLQREDNDWVKKCMEYEVEGARPRGRPKKTWREIVEKDYKAHKLNREDAVDRNRWRKLIRDGWWPR